MDYQLDPNWTLEPIGGDTGEAFLASNSNERVFMKRNSSPFLAVLSMEGIAPRLIWTKRTSNGDILTAQEWLPGQVLSDNEMRDNQVINLLHEYHHSEYLNNMLMKIGGVIYNPIDFVHDFDRDLHPHLKEHSLLSEVKHYLEETIIYIEQAPKTVCHGDLNRRNFLISYQNRLYLVDWEMVKIADPMSDIAQILVQYVPMESWGEWLERYGIELNASHYCRLEWYSLMSLLTLIKKDFKEERFVAVNEKILLLKHIFKNRYYQ